MTKNEQHEANVLQTFHERREDAVGKQWRLKRANGHAADSLVNKPSHVIPDQSINEHSKQELTDVENASELKKHKRDINFIYSEQKQKLVDINEFSKEQQKRSVKLHYTEMPLNGEQYGHGLDDIVNIPIESDASRVQQKRNYNKGLLKKDKNYKLVAKKELAKEQQKRDINFILYEGDTKMPLNIEQYGDVIADLKDPTRHIQKRDIAFQKDIGRMDITMQMLSKSLQQEQTSMDEKDKRDDILTENVRDVIKTDAFETDAFESLKPPDKTIVRMKKSLKISSKEGMLRTLKKLIKNSKTVKDKITDILSTKNVPKTKKVVVNIFGAKNESIDTKRLDKLSKDIFISDMNKTEEAGRIVYNIMLQVRDKKNDKNEIESAIIDDSAKLATDDTFIKRRLNGSVPVTQENNAKRFINASNARTLEDVEVSMNKNDRAIKLKNVKMGGRGYVLMDLVQKSKSIKKFLKSILSSDEIKSKNVTFNLLSELPFQRDPLQMIKSTDAIDIKQINKNANGSHIVYDVMLKLMKNKYRIMDGEGNNRNDAPAKNKNSAALNTTQTISTKNGTTSPGPDSSYQKYAPAATDTQLGATNHSDKGTGSGPPSAIKVTNIGAQGEGYILMNVLNKSSLVKNTLKQILRSKEAKSKKVVVNLLSKTNSLVDPKKSIELADSVKIDIVNKTSDGKRIVYDIVLEPGDNKKKGVVNTRKKRALQGHRKHGVPNAFVLNTKKRSIPFSQKYKKWMSDYYKLIFGGLHKKSKINKNIVNLRLKGLSSQTESMINKKLKHFIESNSRGNFNVRNLIQLRQALERFNTKNHAHLNKKNSVFAILRKNPKKRTQSSKIVLAKLHLPTHSVKLMKQALYKKRLTRQHRQNTRRKKLRTIQMIRKYKMKAFTKSHGHIQPMANTHTYKRMNLERYLNRSKSNVTIINAGRKSVKEQLSEILQPLQSNSVVVIINRSRGGKQHKAFQRKTFRISPSIKRGLNNHQQKIFDRLLHSTEMVGALRFTGTGTNRKNVQKRLDIPYKKSTSVIKRKTLTTYVRKSAKVKEQNNSITNTTKTTEQRMNKTHKSYVLYGAEPSLMSKKLKVVRLKKQPKGYSVTNRITQRYAARNELKNILTSNESNADTINLLVNTTGKNELPASPQDLLKVTKFLKFSMGNRGGNLTLHLNTTSTGQQIDKAKTTAGKMMRKIEGGNRTNGVDTNSTLHMQETNNTGFQTKNESSFYGSETKNNGLHTQNSSSYHGSETNNSGLQFQDGSGTNNAGLQTHNNSSFHGSETIENINNVSLQTQNDMMNVSGMGLAEQSMLRNFGINDSLNTTSVNTFDMPSWASQNTTVVARLISDDESGLAPQPSASSSAVNDFSENKNDTEFTIVNKTLTHEQPSAYQETPGDTDFIIVKPPESDRLQLVKSVVESKNNSQYQNNNKKSSNDAVSEFEYEDLGKSNPLDDFIADRQWKQSSSYADDMRDINTNEQSLIPKHNITQVSTSAVDNKGQSNASVLAGDNLMDFNRNKGKSTPVHIESLSNEFDADGEVGDLMRLLTESRYGETFRKVPFKTTDQVDDILSTDDALYDYLIEKQWIENPNYLFDTNSDKSNVFIHDDVMKSKNVTSRMNKNQLGQKCSVIFNGDDDIGGQSKALNSDCDKTNALPNGDDIHEEKETNTSELNQNTEIKKANATDNNNELLLTFSLPQNRNINVNSTTNEIPPSDDTNELVLNTPQSTNEIPGALNKGLELSALVKVSPGMMSNNTLLYNTINDNDADINPSPNFIGKSSTDLKDIASTTTAKGNTMAYNRYNDNDISSSLQNAPIIDNVGTNTFTSLTVNDITPNSNNGNTNIFTNTPSTTYDVVTPTINNNVLNAPNAVMNELAPTDNKNALNSPSNSDNNLNYNTMSFNMNANDNSSKAWDIPNTSSHVDLATSSSSTHFTYKDNDINPAIAGGESSTTDNLNDITSNNNDAKVDLSDDRDDEDEVSNTISSALDNSKNVNRAADAEFSPANININNDNEEQTSSNATLETNALLDGNSKGNKSSKGENKLKSDNKEALNTFNQLSTNIRNTGDEHTVGINHFDIKMLQRLASGQAEQEMEQTLTAENKKEGQMAQLDSNQSNVTKEMNMKNMLDSSKLNESLGTGNTNNGGMNKYSPQNVSSNILKATAEKNGKAVSDGFQMSESKNDNNSSKVSDALGKKLGGKTSTTSTNAKFQAGAGIAKIPSIAIAKMNEQLKLDKNNHQIDYSLLSGLTSPNKMPGKNEPISTLIIDEILDPMNNSMTKLRTSQANVTAAIKADQAFGVRQNESIGTNTADLNAWVESRYAAATGTGKYGQQVPVQGYRKKGADKDFRGARNNSTLTDMSAWIENRYAGIAFNPGVAQQRIVGPALIKQGIVGSGIIQGSTGNGITRIVDIGLGQQGIVGTKKKENIGTSIIQGNTGTSLTQGNKVTRPNSVAHYFKRQGRGQYAGRWQDLNKAWDRKASMYKYKDYNRRYLPSKRGAKLQHSRRHLSVRRGNVEK